MDGRPVCTLPPGEEIEARFVDGQGCLAQVAGASFYHRLREKFGRLSSMQIAADGRTPGCARQTRLTRRSSDWPTVRDIGAQRSVASGG